MNSSFNPHSKSASCTLLSSASKSAYEDVQAHTVTEVSGNGRSRTEIFRHSSHLITTSQHSRATQATGNHSDGLLLDTKRTHSIILIENRWQNLRGGIVCAVLITNSQTGAEPSSEQASETVCDKAASPKGEGKAI